MTAVSSIFTSYSANYCQVAAAAQPSNDMAKFLARWKD